MSGTLNTASTHDLWVEARQFKLDLTRTSTSVEIKITRPASLKIADGAVILLGKHAIDASSWPEDGTKYTASSTLVSPPPETSLINGFQVVGFYSAIMGAPFPVGEVVDGAISWTISVEVQDDLATPDFDGIYFASIHPATKVLQYYPIGVQSYPLDGAQLEKSSNTYTGSIPSLPSAPTSPTPGMVYFDQQIKIVQYWDADRGVWIPTRADAILSGDQNPGVIGQAYLIGNSLRLFTGFAWVTATPTNLSFLTGTAPAFTSISAGKSLPESPAPGDVFYSHTTRVIQYWDGVSWQVPGKTNSLLATGSTVVPAFTVPFTVEHEDLITPYTGMLFYNLTTHALNAWNGLSWERANTAQAGTPTSDKVGIGNDGSYDQRIRLVNILKSQLGWPAQCVELTEAQFNIAIDNALDTYRQLSIGAYEQRFMVFQLVRGQQTYFLNSPTDRSDSIVSVTKINRSGFASIGSVGSDNVWNQAFVQQHFSSMITTGPMVEMQLLSNWSEDMSRMFAGDMPFVWNEARRELFIKRTVRDNEKVVLEVELERTEQELMMDRFCKQWVQGWAISECKEMLGLIRSKFSSGTPGANGTITLNGDTLLSEARTDFTDLRQQLLDYEAQNAEHGSLAFIIG